jgi:DNA helicase-2/ATP-dependent DNA helicase PcrA
MKLNPEQELAVDHFEGPCIVTAVPGSGKTRVLTERVVALIKKGVAPKNILCTTFTNKAANEMRERVAAKVGESANEIFINTFHGLSLALLRKFPTLIGLQNPFSIYTEKDQIDLMGKVARMQGYEMTKDQLEFLGRTVNDFREDTENCERHVEHLSIAEKEVLQGYLKVIDELNAVDFSGILFKCWKLLENQKVVEILSNRFKFVMVDEAQDMNDIQYEITKRIGTHANLFYVGDYHQSIFSWRGARPDNLLRFKKDYPSVKEIVLPRNYRSTSDILRVAQRLIRHNDNAKDVELISVKGVGRPVRIEPTMHDESEADYVVSKIGNLRCKYKLKDFAILFRIGSQSRVLEQRLRAAGIPYRIVGSYSFFDRREIKTALAYMQIVANPSDTVAFARAMAEPRRGVGDVAIGKIEKYCHENKVSVIDACKKIDNIDGLPPKARETVRSFVQNIVKYRDADAKGEPIAKLAADLFDDMGYTGYLKELGLKNDKERQRLDGVNELLTNMADFYAASPKAKLNDYLQSVLLTTPDAQENEDDVVSLLTMHSAKGLEFPVVFIVGCNEHVVPHHRAVSERGLDEERRLMYVAITRAQEFLYITHRNLKRKFDKSTGQNSFIHVKPSCFIYEIAPNYDPTR